jgi:hypothetical protein
MNTLSLRDVVRNAAAVFSGAYGAVTGRAQQAGCSRQTVYQHARQVEQLYQHARQVEQRLQAPGPTTPPAEPPIPISAPSLDEPGRRRFAVTAFAMGISTRQIEELLRVLLADRAPDHSTIARWVADAAEKAEPVLRALDAASVPEVRTLAVDEIFFGGDRPWSASSRPA